MAEEKKKSDMIRLCGLWEDETSAGDTYFSGTLSPTSKILIFRNNHKESPSQPDWNVFLAPRDPKPEGSDSGSTRTQSGRSATQPPAAGRGQASTQSRTAQPRTGGQAERKVDNQAYPAGLEEETPLDDPREKYRR